MCIPSCELCSFDLITLMHCVSWRLPLDPPPSLFLEETRYSFPRQRGPSPETMFSDSLCNSVHNNASFFFVAEVLCVCRMWPGSLWWRFRPHFRSPIRQGTLNSSLFIFQSSWSQVSAVDWATQSSICKDSAEDTEVTTSEDLKRFVWDLPTGCRQDPEKL